MSSNMDFEHIWNKIIACQGETFHTVRGISFTYTVEEENLHPSHIKRVPRRHPTKAGFEKAFQLDSIKSPSQLNAEGILGSSYIYAILTDPRIKGSL